VCSSVPSRTEDIAASTRDDDQRSASLAYWHSRRCTSVPDGGLWKPWAEGSIGTPEPPQATASFIQDNDRSKQIPVDRCNPDRALSDRTNTSVLYQCAACTALRRPILRCGRVFRSDWSFFPDFFNATRVHIDGRSWPNADYMFVNFAGFPASIRVSVQRKRFNRSGDGWLPG